MTATLAEIQRALASAYIEQINRALGNDFFKSFPNIWELLASFDTGFHLTFPDLRDLAASSKVQAAVRAYKPWQPTEIFNDDSGYSNERMYLVLAAWDEEVGAEADFWDPAIRQGLRMLATGRVDLSFLEPIEHRAQKSDETLAREYLVAVAAADEILQAQFQRRHEMLMNSSFDDNFFVDVAAEQERQFRQLWLPAVLSPQELQEVAGLSLSVLQGLYPQIWVQRYFGYRRRLRQRQVTGSA